MAPGLEPEPDLIPIDADDRDDDVASHWFIPNDPHASVQDHAAIARFMCGDTPGAEMPPISQPQ